VLRSRRDEGCCDFLLAAHLAMGCAASTATVTPQQLTAVAVITRDDNVVAMPPPPPPPRPNSPAPLPVPDRDEDVATSDALAELAAGADESFKPTEMDGNRKRFDVFISHKQTDAQDLASLLDEHLTSRGYRVFRDRKLNLRAGSEDDTSQRFRSDGCRARVARVPRSAVAQAV